MNACTIAYTDYELDYRVRRYAELLADGKNRIDVIALRDQSGESFSTLNGVNIHKIQERNYRETGLASYLKNYICFMVSGSILLTRMYFRHRYKIIHVHNVPDFLVFMALIPRLFGAKIILDIHDVLPEFYCKKFGKEMDSSLARLLLLVERLSIKFSHHVIAANDIWREKLIARNRLNPLHCTTLLNYPVMKFFEDNEVISKGDGFHIIYPGTLSHQHGVDILIRAMAIVKREDKNIHLDIYPLANVSAIRRQLEELIITLNVKDIVHFHETVRPEKLGDIFRNADVGVVPKRGGGFTEEAFSSKIFEYMAAGIPVIASRTRIDTYYFDDSLIKFFTPEDHNDLAKCIIELYLEPEKRHLLVENGEKYIENNTWEVKKVLYSDIVRDLCKAKPRGPLHPPAHSS